MSSKHVEWTIEDTKLWIHEVSLKLEAIDYWLNETVSWCEKHDIESEQTVFTLSMLTILWVGYKLGEPISRQQALEILEVPDWEQVDDKLLTLPPKYGELELPILLRYAIDDKLNL